MLQYPYVRRYSGEGAMTCYFCGKLLDEEKRAIEPTLNGQKYFCWSPQNQITPSCYQKYKHKELS